MTRELKAPSGLTVETFTMNGDDFAVLTWPLPLRRQRPLSPGLAEVLAYVADGLSNAEIGRRRGTSPRTVANQIASLLRIFSVGSRMELALFADGRSRGEAKGSCGPTR